MEPEWGLHETNPFDGSLRYRGRIILIESGDPVGAVDMAEAARVEISEAVAPLYVHWGCSGPTTTMAPSVWWFGRAQTVRPSWRRPTGRAERPSWSAGHGRRRERH